MTVPVVPLCPASMVLEKESPMFNTLSLSLAARAVPANRVVIMQAESTADKIFLVNFRIGISLHLFLDFVLLYMIFGHMLIKFCLFFSYNYLRKGEPREPSLPY